MRDRLLLLCTLAIPSCFDPSSDDDTSTTSTSTTPETGSDSGSTSTDSVSTGPGDGDSTSDGADGTTGECASGCDDGIECTEDACVDGSCEHTPVDTLCDDGIECTEDACDAAMGCVNAPQDAMCDDGVPCTVDACDPAAGCAAVPDDAMCDDGIGCTVDTCDAMAGCGSAPDDSLCDDANACTFDTCDAMLDCSNEAVVLVYNGANGQSTSPEDAITGMGYTPIVVTNEADFIAAFDAGGFVAIVIDVATGVEFSTIPVEMRTRVDNWIAGDGRVVFGFWNLDADASMQTSLGVGVSASLSSILPIHPDPAGAADLFASPESIPAPLVVAGDFWADNGDQLLLNGPGWLAARFNDAAAGPGAIAVTHSDHVITNGFTILEIGQAGTDADMDMINDGEELLRNEISYICGVP